MIVNGHETRHAQKKVSLMDLFFSFVSQSVEQMHGSIEVRPATGPVP
jgi:hypothetical protein